MPGSNDRNRTIYQRLAAVYDLAAKVPPHPENVTVTPAKQPEARALQRRWDRSVPELTPQPPE